MHNTNTTIPVVVATVTAYPAEEAFQGCQVHAPQSDPPVGQLSRCFRKHSLLDGHGGVHLALPGNAPCGHDVWVVPARTRAIRCVPMLM